MQNRNAPPAVILFSIIALEKFAQTTENKITIQKRLQEASTIVDNEQESPKNNYIDGQNNKLNSIYPLEKGIAFKLKALLLQMLKNLSIESNSLEN